MTADLQPNDCRAANDACVGKQCPPGGNKEASDDENEPNSPHQESVGCVSGLRVAGQGGAVVGQEVPAETAQYEYPSQERHSPPGDRSKHALDCKHGETDLRKTLELCNKENEPMTDEIDEITNRSGSRSARSR